MSSKVVLNIGGQKYETKLSLLKTVPNTVLSSIADTVNNQENQELFIDRDGRLFTYILNYFRNLEKVVLPLSELDLLELQQETNYYCIEKLDALIQQKLNKIELKRKENYRECIYCKNTLDITLNLHTQCPSKSNRLHSGPIVYNEEKNQVKIRYSCCGDMITTMDDENCDSLYQCQFDPFIENKHFFK